MHTVGPLWHRGVRYLLGNRAGLWELVGPYVVDERVLFLSYPRGSFIAAHRDGATDEHELAAAVFVLNDDFEGGAFVIHQEDRELALDVAPGTLIVLRSGVLHSVREVTAGVRFAAVGSLNAAVAIKRIYRPASRTGR
jgi:predicted 2-oxoglutarate/Fe(II)-dependent dioxygenase YbiX